MLGQPRVVFLSEKQRLAKVNLLEMMKRLR